MTSDKPNLVEGEVLDAVLLLRISAPHIQDADVSYALRDQMIALADEFEATNLVIDFSHVRFMGSIGLLALMSLRRRAPNGRIILCRLSEPIHQAFVACRLIPSERSNSAVFETTQTVEQALREFRQ